ncbi:SUMO-targeted ubiquitin-protein ligase E3 Slx8 [Schizosaccharomyces octosporus yFS286]|uniref:SUMO-targeted ubiquitin-protein ligase E3 Slx8 n=1 Tax=Schizosaccharomyces octosporus (strain yFS286) TaxID=483514 RepID=S9Q270_SCHOY|nr:SUMO-targeted ubiquitin-protein ligase E3 Slx8 [Schizosaccharomyces octosporus yFS286]EPX74182.1 SUMO-targeted ubiquitin-protein ligase E3 Slx8 [Schizosaccharomyces octosporus yFS286]
MPPTPRSGNQRYTPYNTRATRSPREAAAIAAASRQRRGSNEISFSVDEALNEGHGEPAESSGVSEREVIDQHIGDGEQQALEVQRAPQSVRSLAYNESVQSPEGRRNELLADLEGLDDIESIEDVSLRELSHHPRHFDNFPSRFDDVIDLTTAEQKQSQPKQRKRKQRPNQEVTPQADSLNNSQRLADYKCVICLDNPENLSATPCGHIFCNFCILSALGTSSATQKCPVCRRKVHPKNVICLEMMLGSKQNNN